MPTILDPIYCQVFIPTSPSAQYMKVNLPNNTNIQAIRITNKGAFDVKYNGFGVNGQEWILAGESVCFSHDLSNNGFMQFLSYASNANSDSRYYDVAWRSVLLVTTYQFGEQVDYTRWTVPIYGPTSDTRVLNAPACQGTTVSVPLSTGTFAPFTNTTLEYLLGFDLTIGAGAANASADLIIQNLSAQHGNSATMNYMLSNSQPIYTIKYPRNGLANFTGSPIQFVVPNLSTSVIDLCVYYSYNADMTA
jgi:hypothetical protein